MDPLIYFIIVIICLLLSAFFSGSETALLRLTKDMIEKDLEKSGRLSIMAAKELIKTPAKLLVTILLGNNVVNILGASCASALGVYYFGEQKGIVISTVAMTLIVLIFSEILPKSIAAKNPGKLGYFVALPLYIIHKVSTPIHFLYERTIDPLVRLIAGKQSEGPLASTAESIMKLAEGLKVRKGDGTPIPIIGSAAAAAASLYAEDILISRAEIFALDEETSILEAEKLLGKSRYTRAIVYQDSLDKIHGIIHLKDLVRANNSEDQEEKKTVKDLIKPVLFVPGKMPILSVLPRMQKGLIHTAIIQDAFGVTKGMLTQEDILEEIVGEIRDEFDTDELKRIKKISVGNYQVLGNLSLHDFNRETGWNLPGERGESISEILYTELGRAPKKDDSITFESYSLKVLDMSGKRLARIEITKV